MVFIKGNNQIELFRFLFNIINCKYNFQLSIHHAISSEFVTAVNIYIYPLPSKIALLLFMIPFLSIMYSIQQTALETLLDHIGSAKLALFTLVLHSLL